MAKGKKGSRKARPEKRRVITREKKGSLENVLKAVLLPERGQKVLRVETERSPTQQGLLITPTKNAADG